MSDFSPVLRNWAHYIFSLYQYIWYQWKATDTDFHMDLKDFVSDNWLKSFKWVLIKKQIILFSK